MNYEMVVYVLLNIAKIEGVLMMIPGIVSLIYGEYNTAKVILTIAILLAAFGFIFTLKKPRRLSIFLE